ncbi:hypothetical protein QWY85_08760 [Neolewinella lacunae]|uniref:Uncharacterized protein n=1 Tax=Neolewinella lacunae TaxID=1517758 RepID=A0A923TA65_9BACT|nr:hypothetical protein [Neolewinella lacunae]MBC6996234.1 hypothetical protein [Neolewinella lacunae]MDN3634746.1 hypothetical protein [Neolewinella lacunae]
MKYFPIVLVITVFLLLIPFVAMQFTAEVNWDIFDFVVMGTLLFTTGMLLAQIPRWVPQRNYRILLGCAVLGAFFLVWAELAVGIFGSPFAGS